MKAAGAGVKVGWGAVPTENYVHFEISTGKKKADLQLHQARAPVSGVHRRSVNM